MGVLTRPMMAGDKGQVVALLSGIPEFQSFEVLVAEEVIDSYLGNRASGYYIMVAEAESVIAGYICYGPTPLTESTWDIYWMATRPAKQGQGIGKTMLRLAEKHISEAGGRQSLIETSSKPGYERARAFYLNYGYELVARINDFYAPGDDRLIFRKRFPSGG
ncbi:MAG: GNAT family N-acetyltransferase [Chloroflexi bacterium]|nr:GNAT family N-acetyltransferase [Chloroflexota bacterium]